MLAVEDIVSLLAIGQNKVKGPCLEKSAFLAVYTVDESDLIHA